MAEIQIQEGLKDYEKRIAGSRMERKKIEEGYLVALGDSSKICGLEI